jgi:3-hydroxyacyl-[acyl-carrier-protein] dehydratase
MSLTLSHAEIRKMLPHRHPFLFVDKVLSVEPAAWIRAEYGIPVDHPFVIRDIERPGFPPALLLEALAQAASVCALCAAPNELHRTGSGYLAAVDGCVLKDCAPAGHPVELEASLTRRYASLFRFSAVARVTGREAVKANLTLYLEA